MADSGCFIIVAGEQQPALRLPLLPNHLIQTNPDSHRYSLFFWHQLQDLDCCLDDNVVQTLSYLLLYFSFLTLTFSGKCRKIFVENNMYLYNTILMSLILLANCSLTSPLWDLLNSIFLFIVLSQYPIKEYESKLYLKYCKLQKQWIIVGFVYFSI